MPPVVSDLLVVVDELVNLVEEGLASDVVQHPHEGRVAVGLDPPKHLLVAVELLADFLALRVLIRREPLDHVHVLLVSVLDSELPIRLILLEIDDLERIFINFLRARTFLFQLLILQDQVGGKKQLIEITDWRLCKKIFVVLIYRKIHRKSILRRKQFRVCETAYVVKLICVFRLIAVILQLKIAVFKILLQAIFVGQVY